MPDILPKFAPAAVALDAVPLPGRLNYHNDINAELSPGLAAAKNFMAKGLEIANNVNERRKLVDPTITLGANLAGIEDMVRDASAKFDKGYVATKVKLTASTAEAEAKLATSTALPPTPTAPEIRAVFRSMTAAERSAALVAAFASGDKEILGAIVGSNSLIHGCDPEQVTAQHDAYKQRVAPHEYANVQEHRKSLGYLEQCPQAIWAWQARALKGTAGYATARSKAQSLLASYGIEYED